MAQQKKAKPKSKRKRSATTNTDAEQSERFKQIARELGADESGKSFDKAFKKIITTAQPAKKAPR